MPPCSSFAWRKTLIHLGSLIGAGILLLDTEELGKADYSIHVWRDEKENVKRADGKIETHDSTIDRVIAVGSVQLQLETGGKIELVVKPHRIMVGRAGVLVKGAVPGF
jgi:hypothetical protein